MQLREKKFMLGKLHGKNLKEEDKKEARIRNDMFLVGKLKKEEKIIDIIGYEMPLEGEKKRGKCIDLFGVDCAQCCPYIVELKRGDSKENLNKAINQIEGYEKNVEQIKECIEKEIEEKFNYSEFKLKGRVEKIILAPEKYYKEQVRKGQHKKNGKTDLNYCYYFDESELRKNKLLRQPVTIQRFDFNKNFIK